jgi:MFS family permease
LDNESPSSISWIGSTQAFLLLVVGVATGVLFDKGYFRPMLWVGSVMVVFGMMMTSIAKEFTHIILAQGLCVGIAQGLLFVSSVAILPQHFTTKKALANGIAASGSSLGGIIYPIVFRQMEQSVGFGWATRTIAFLAFFTLGISISLLKLRAVPRTTRKLLDLGAVRTPALYS